MKMLLEEINDRNINYGIFLQFVKKTSEELKVNKGVETIKSYNQLIEKLSEYEAEKHKELLFTDINISFYNDFQNWFFNKKYSANYFGKMIKIIKMFMNEANERGVTSCQGHRHKMFVKTAVESENIYLSVDELLKIYKLNLACFPAGKLKTYEAVKYKFLIGAFTGLRVSDFNKNMCSCAVDLCVDNCTYLRVMRLLYIIFVLKHVKSFDLSVHYSNISCIFAEYFNKVVFNT